jgi:NADH dehydrogenase [ubiquinone] 1 alpha subcomplex assembly factor 7
MPIDAHIRHHIKENGHIKLNDMMREVLSNNHESYYRSTKHIGENGDFITSPEISQLFGEMIALWAMEKWIIIGCPQEFALIELGPGTGRLMQDFLRVARLNKEFFSAIRVFLYEINPFFINSQKARTFEYNKKISWIKDIQELPNLPAIIIANEFFDALPVKQYLKVEEKWFERVLVVDPVDGRIKFSKIEVNKVLQNQLLLEHKNAYDGAVIEESVESLDIVRKLSYHIKKYKGAALIIDYGYSIHPIERLRSQYNSTLQAIKDHQYSPIIDTLGEADLTTHVDFYALSRAANEQNINQISFKTQRNFLLKYGIELRLSTLKDSLSHEDFIIIQKQVHRLIAQEQMGELFKVLEIYVEKSST